MENGMESPLVAAQRSAIQQIRGRYERGEISIDTFRDGLDALTKTETPEECAAILRDLPHSPLAALTALAALEPHALAPSAPALPAMPPMPATLRRRISAFMSETKKTRGPWSLAPDTDVRAFMGSVKLDLRRAQIPARAHLDVKTTMGEIVIYIPDDVEVAVHSKTWFGEVKALGESISGVVASGYEEHRPNYTTPRAQLVIEASSLMGSVHIVVANSTNVAIADLARDALRAALDGVRRGFENGAQGASLPSSSARPGLPGAPAE